MLSPLSLFIGHLLYNPHGCHLGYYYLSLPIRKLKFKEFKPFSQTHWKIGSEIIRIWSQAVWFHFWALDLYLTLSAPVKHAVSLNSGWEALIELFLNQPHSLFRMLLENYRINSRTQTVLNIHLENFCVNFVQNTKQDRVVNINWNQDLFNICRKQWLKYLRPSFTGCCILEATQRIIVNWTEGQHIRGES